MATDSEPRYMGGQAVIEGVMMRGQSTWAVSVRLPDGSIETAVHPVAGWSERYRAIPLLRGVMGLGESLSLGYRALAWSANRQIAAVEGSDAGNDSPALSETAVRVTMAVSMVLFSAIFLVAPALVGKGLKHSFDAVPFPLLEAAVRIGFFVGYLTLISRMKDIRRVFEYHGAEHKAIAAYENEGPLNVEFAQTFSTAHVRCGTNFLLTVMVIAIVCYSFVPTPNVLAIVASRIVLLPLIAGLSYELIRFAAKRMHLGFVRWAMKPGLLLQKLTTREPSDDQIEVAISALRACMTDVQLAEVDNRPLHAASVAAPSSVG